MDTPVLVDQQKLTFIRSVLTLDVVYVEDLLSAVADEDEWWERPLKESMLSVRFDDDDDDDLRKLFVLFRFLWLRSRINWDLKDPFEGVSNKFFFFFLSVRIYSIFVNHHSFIFCPRVILIKKVI